MKELKKFEISREDIEIIDQCQICEDFNVSELSSVTVQRSGFKFFATAYCRNCGFVFRSRRPHVEWFEEIWKKRRSDSEAVINLSKNKEIETLRYDRYRNLSRVLSRFVEKKNLLDIGCGPGTGLTAFVDEGWDVTGIEPDPVRANEGIENHGLNIVASTIEDFVPTEKYDIATLVHVLEHFHSPVELLKKTADCVKDGGYIYVEVPHLFRFVNLQDSFYLEHMSNFTEKTLTYAGYRCGLAVQEIFATKTNPSGANHLAILFRKSEERLIGKLTLISNVGTPWSIRLADHCEPSDAFNWIMEMESDKKIDDEYHRKLQYLYRQANKPDEDGKYSSETPDLFSQLPPSTHTLSYIVPHINDIVHTIAADKDSGTRYRLIGNKILVTITTIADAENEKA